MTRIITITSGLAQVGKTHLAVNLALELARRGRRSGVYHELGAATSIDQVLDLPHVVTQRRRAMDAQNAHDFIRRGYLGIDILSCRLPLRDWAGGKAVRPRGWSEQLQAELEYDELLIDTSGMDPRSLIASCRASASVILILTPDEHSQAQAFAMLKVLVLNGYAGELRMVVNRVSGEREAQEIQQRFNTQVQAHLGGEIPMLGCLPEDARVARARDYLQAFSAIFPDCDATAAIVSLAAALPEVHTGETDQRSLAGYWSRFIEIIPEPVHLAGNVVLQEPAAAQVEPADAAAGGMVEQENLLLLGGEIEQLAGILERAAESLQSASTTLAFLAASLEDTQAVLPETPAAQLETVQLPTVVAQLLAMLMANTERVPVELRVDRVSIGSADGTWLRPGRYLKYTLQLVLPFEIAQSHLQALLPDVPVQQILPGVAQDTLREILTRQHDGCLDILTNAAGELRIQVWLPVAMPQPSALPARGNVPAGKRLH